MEFLTFNPYFIEIKGGRNQPQPSFGISFYRKELGSFLGS